VIRAEAGSIEHILELAESARQARDRRKVEDSQAAEARDNANREEGEAAQANADEDNSIQALKDAVTEYSKEVDEEPIPEPEPEPTPET
jgi:hypothetical protein